MIPLPSPAAVVERSEEFITHFRCADAKCAQWWSISDGPTDRALHCPHCGQTLTPAQYPDPKRPPATPPQEIAL